MNQVSRFISFIGISFTYLSNINLKYPLIIEKCVENNSLEDFIEKSMKENSRKFTNTKKMIIIYGIAQIMMNLYNNHMLYENLTAKNVLLDEEDHPFLKSFETSNFKIEILIHSFTSKNGKLFFYVLNGKQIDENTSIKYDFNDSTTDSIHSYFNCIISSTLEKDPKKRPSFTDIVNLFDSRIIFPSILSSENELHIYSDYVDFI